MLIAKVSAGFDASSADPYKINNVSSKGIILLFYYFYSTFFFIITFFFFHKPIYLINY